MEGVHGRIPARVPVVLHVTGASSSLRAPHRHPDRPLRLRFPASGRSAVSSAPRPCRGSAVRWPRHPGKVAGATAGARRPGLLVLYAGATLFCLMLVLYVA